jgi:hypothetical protein
MAQLKFDSDQFVRSVLANPENQPLNHQPSQIEAFCDPRLLPDSMENDVSDIFSESDLFTDGFDDLDLDLDSQNSVLANLS